MNDVYVFSYRGVVITPTELTVNRSTVSIRAIVAVERAKRTHRDRNWWIAVISLGLGLWLSVFVMTAIGLDKAYGAAIWRGLFAVLLIAPSLSYLIRRGRKQNRIICHTAAGELWFGFDDPAKAQDAYDYLRSVLSPAPGVVIENINVLHVNGTMRIPRQTI